MMIISLLIILLLTLLITEPRLTTLCLEIFIRKAKENLSNILKTIGLLWSKLYHQTMRNSIESLHTFSADLKKLSDEVEQEHGESEQATLAFIEELN